MSPTLQAHLEQTLGLRAAPAHQSLDISPDKPLPFALLAEKFPGRSAKQIRERYQNKLDSSITRTKFTEAEDRVILEFYKTNGPKWEAA